MQQPPIFTSNWTYNGKEVLTKSYLSDSFANLKNVTQCYCLVVNEEEKTVLIVSKDEEVCLYLAVLWKKVRAIWNAR